MRENREPARPGPKVSPADVAAYPDAAFYEPTVLRTLFLEFEDADWETELADFYRTDVEVPARLTVDGKEYTGVGVRYRGNTSYMMAGQGYKKPLNISVDFTEATQRLYGYKNLNLLNSNEDPSMLRVVLYLEIMRHYTPAPKANFVKLVVNQESWGVYVNLQQFDKQFLKEWYPDSKGVRWKVPVNFRGGGLTYLGDDIEEYKRNYEMKSDDGDKAWKDLMALCKALDATPSDKLEETLRPMLDIDHVLWYLAIDNLLINNDGYWIRGSDFGIFRDSRKQFHIVAHDVNETFRSPGGPGFGGPPGGGRGRGFRPGRGGPSNTPESGPAPTGARSGEPDSGFGPGRPGPGFGGPGGGRGPRGQGIDLDPLAGADDRNKPLLNRLLAVPALKEQYLRNMRTVAEDWLDWEKIGPLVDRYHALIGKEVEADTRKLYTTAAFLQGAAESPASGEQEEGPRFGPGREMSIRSFVEQRRQYILNHPEIRQLPR